MAAHSTATLLQNYLKLYLRMLVEPRVLGKAPNMNIHCISGWDRTPLMVSLIRASLWADGVAHASLSPAEMLYLLVGYDWVLFGCVVAISHTRTRYLHTHNGLTNVAAHVRQAQLLPASQGGRRGHLLPLLHADQAAQQRVLVRCCRASAPTELRERHRRPLD